MKNTIRKITALTLAVLTLAGATSCGRDKPEEINDSQESSSEDNRTAEKNIITAAVIAYDPNIQDIANKFNKNSECYEIRLNIYEDESETETAFKKFQIDLASGKAPDVVFATPEDMITLIKADYMTDIYPLMDQYAEVKKEHFLPNVLEGLEFDNILPALCPHFNISTAAAKTELVGIGSENWSIQDVMTAYNEQATDDYFLFHEYSDWDLPNYMLRLIGRSFIDFENSTCNFTNDEFIEFIRFISELPRFENKHNWLSEISESEAQDWQHETEMSLINNKALVEEIWLTGINSHVSSQIYAQFGGADITYVGYPSLNGCGAVTETQMMLGIFESSTCKEGAWEFLSQFFERTVQKQYGLNGSGGIPVTSAAIESLAFDVNESTAQSSREQLLLPDGSGNMVQITDEALRRLIDYISNISIDVYFDSQLDSIIKEEIRAVREGEKTAEEVAEILQGRVEIYLSERS